MEKEFVPYELTVKLKELGFNEPCLGYYAGDILCTGQPQEMHLDKDGNYKKTKTESYPIIAAPTYSQAFRWFREKHDLVSWITRRAGFHKEYSWYISNFNNDDPNEYQFDSHIETYEETELACLDKLIEIVENK